MELSKRFSFDAAHWLPKLPDGHKCRRLHGHSFRITVTVSGEVDPRIGWVMDFADIGAAVAPLHQVLDHRLLNEVEGLENPTSENLAQWCWQRLDPTLPGLWCVEVEETCTTSCRYFGPEAVGRGE